MTLDEFVNNLLDSKQNTQLMARILLNTFGESEEYPVDVHELRKLTPPNFAAVMALMQWAQTSSTFKYEGCRRHWILSVAIGHAPDKRD